MREGRRRKGKKIIIPWPSYCSLKKKKKKK
jgi:hypothetical protein